MKAFIASLFVFTAIALSSTGILAQSFMGYMSSADCKAAGGISESTLTDANNPDPVRPCRRPAAKEEPPAQKMEYAPAPKEVTGSIGEGTTDNKQIAAPAKKGPEECKKKLDCSGFTCVTVMCNSGLGAGGIYGGMKDAGIIKD